MSPSPKSIRRRRRAVKHQSDDSINQEFQIDTKSRQAYGYHIGTIARALITQRFNPNYNPQTAFDPHWENAKRPTDVTVKIAELWKSQYLTNMN